MVGSMRVSMCTRVICNNGDSRHKLVEERKRPTIPTNPHPYEKKRKKGQVWKLDRYHNSRDSTSASRPIKILHLDSASSLSLVLLLILYENSFFFF